MSQKVFIPEWELEYTYARSSGPGGQNVNKVNSKAVLRWCLATSTCLDEATRSRLLLKLANELTVNGEIVIASDVHRDQLKNKQECLGKLQNLIARALHENKKRKKTKISRSTKRKNLDSKKKHSEKKRLRKNYD